MTEHNQQIEHPAIDKLLSEAKLHAADPKPSIEEMRQAIADEAWRREGSQRARLIAGMNDAPIGSEMRQIVVLDAAVRFIDAVINQPADVAKRLNAKASAQRKASQNYSNS